MSAAQTAEAPSASAAVHPSLSRPRRRDVGHLFWVASMEAAEAMGVQCRTLCGRWEFLHRKPEDRDKPRNVLETVGDLVPLPEPKDCKNCLRVFVAARRRQYDRKVR